MPVAHGLLEFLSRGRRSVPRIETSTTTHPSSFSCLAMTTTDGNDEAAEARKRRKAILNADRHCDSVSEGARSILAISKQLVEETNAERLLLQQQQQQQHLYSHSDSGNDSGRADRAMSVASTASSAGSQEVSLLAKRAKRHKFVMIRPSP
jgi:hypothetical protein